MNMIINVCIVVALTAMLAGCSMDSAQLGEYVRKEMKRGSDYFDDVAADQARYYKDHPNGNWSGD